MSSQRETQVEANYRRGNPINDCGSCQYYQGAITKRCTQVMGTISALGLCDIHTPVPNPFGPTLTPQETQQIKMIAANAAARAQGGAAPTPQGGGQPMPPPPQAPMRPPMGPPMQ